MAMPSTGPLRYPLLHFDGGNTLKQALRYFLVFAIVCTSGLAAAQTAFTANLKQIVGSDVSKFRVGLAVQNCSNYILRIPGPFTAVGDTVYLPPDGNGLVSAAVPDQANVGCGSTAASVYYTVSIVAWDPVGAKPVLPAKRLNNYDITGATFNLNTALPRGAPAPASVANAMLLNPAGDQTAVIPSGKKIVFSGGTVDLSGTTCIGCTGTGGSGTVTSVGLALPNLFTVTVTPVTTSGVLTAILASQSANRMFAGPTTGSAAAPTFRAMVNADLPSAIAVTSVDADALTTRGLVAQKAGSGPLIHTISNIKNGVENFYVDENGNVNTPGSMLATGGFTGDLFGNADTATSVTGVVPVAKGGAGIANTGAQGKVLIGNGSGQFVEGDPLVQGLFADGSTSAANPVAIGGYDIAGTPALHRVAAVNGAPAGTEYAFVTRNIPSGTQAVSGTFWQATQPVSGTFWQATQPVSGTVTATQATGTNLHMVCDSGCSSSAGFADNATFTTGTTAINPAGGLFDDTPPTAVATGKAAAARITNNRALHTNLRNQAGTEIGTASNPIQVSLANTAANVTAVKVDGSAVTQPVSGTVTANIGTAGTLALDATLTGGSAKTQGNVASSATDSGNPVKIGGPFNTTQPTVTNGQRVDAQMTARGAQIVAPGVDNFAVQVNAAIPAGTNLIGKVGIDQTTPGTTNGVQDAATGTIGSAVPSKGAYVAGNSSGNLTGIIACDQSAPINMSTATTTQIIPISGTGGRTYICSYDLVVAGANNVTIISGSGTNCASNQAALIGGTTAASGYNFAANGGIAKGSGLGMILKTTTTNNEVCIVTSAAVQLSGSISYTQF
jgi:hypothetical protein